MNSDYVVVFDYYLTAIHIFPPRTLNKRVGSKLKSRGRFHVVRTDKSGFDRTHDEAARRGIALTVH